MASSVSSCNRANLIASAVRQGTGLSEDLSYMVVGSLSPLETGKHEGLQEWQFRMDPSNIRSEALRTIYKSKKIFGSESIVIRETHKEAVQKIEDWRPLLREEFKKHPDVRLSRFLEGAPIELRQSEMELLLDKISEIKDPILVDFFHECRQWTEGQRPVSESAKRIECVNKKMEELDNLPLNEQARELRKWLRDDSLPILQQETMPLLNLYIPPEIIHFEKLDRESFVGLLSRSVRKDHFDTVRAMIQSDRGEVFPKREKPIPALCNRVFDSGLNAECTRILLELDKNRTIPTDKVKSAFFEAYTFKNCDKVRAIMESNQGKDIPSNGGLPGPLGFVSITDAFDFACRNNLPRLVELFIQSDRWHDITSLRNGLIDACSKGYEEIVQMIMESDRWRDISAAIRDEAYRQATPEVKDLLRPTQSCTERVMSIFVSWFFPPLGHITS